MLVQTVAVLADCAFLSLLVLNYNSILDATEQASSWYVRITMQLTVIRTHATWEEGFKGTLSKSNTMFSDITARYLT